MNIETLLKQYLKPEPAPRQLTARLESRWFRPSAVQVLGFTRFRILTPVAASLAFVALALGVHSEARGVPVRASALGPVIRATAATEAAHRACRLCHEGGVILSVGKELRI